MNEVPNCFVYSRLSHAQLHNTRGTTNIIYSLFFLLQPMLLHASTFLTVMMARERYLAISNPTEYRNATLLQGGMHT